MGKGRFRTALAMLHDPFGVSGKQRVNDLHNLRIHEERSSASLRCTAWASERASRHGIDEVLGTILSSTRFTQGYGPRKSLAVNDDLDDATIAFIENMLLFLMKKIHFFWQTFGYLVASEKRIPSTKLLQRISLSILRSAGAINLFFQQARYCIASIDGDPVPARPVASVNPSIASPQSALRPKVTEHCQTASRKSDRTLHRPLSCPAFEVVQVGHRKGFATPKGASLCPTDLGLKGSGGSSARGTGRAAEAGLWMVDPPATRPDVRVPHQYQMVHGDADAQQEVPM
ncbi:hypothetical protein PAPYR_1614 [Paratrimastix pyriformis]|uniref:Uncharacterized protein n=1 Tax=Paratrimastix pyriformis TaxID=342808 RepID=A0ABQ8UWG7_9EUKA|nr:hypothetical protein PAPYR_1614 [Paratrimastix pyriformis]